MMYYMSESAFDSLLELAEILKDERLDAIIEQIEGK